MRYSRNIHLGHLRRTAMDYFQVKYRACQIFNPCMIVKPFFVSTLYFTSQEQFN
uniref:Uncharacterized protein n=1 Tax=Rhizophora mucronata TaxID=61149 RepID=A0A2P2MZH8_RHIMU